MDMKPLLDSGRVWLSGSRSNLVVGKVDTGLLGGVDVKSGAIGVDRVVVGLKVLVSENPLQGVSAALRALSLSLQ